MIEIRSLLIFVGLALSLFTAAQPDSTVAGTPLALASPVPAEGPSFDVLRILGANEIRRDHAVEGAERWLGEVRLAFKESRMTCDSLWRMDDGRYRAMGDVVWDDGEGGRILAQSVWINQDRRWAIADGAPVLWSSPEGDITAPRLAYDFDTRVARFELGATMVNDGTVVTADRGAWWAEQSELRMGGNVVIEGENERVTSDSLHYRRDLERIVFCGPSAVVRKDGSFELYCAEGQYAVGEASGHFAAATGEQVSIRSDENWVHADSVAVMPGDSLRFAWGNVLLTDTAGTFEMRGGESVQRRHGIDTLAWQSELTGKYEGTRAGLVQYNDRDTLQLTCDTLLHFPGVSGQYLQAFPSVLFRYGSSSGTCDTLLWAEADSLLEFRAAPRLWLEGQLLQAERIDLKMGKSGPLNLLATGGACLLSETPIDSLYDQIFGRTIRGHFASNSLEKLHVEGNAEAVYFVSQEQDMEVDSLAVSDPEFNRVSCSSMVLRLENGTVTRISLIDSPLGQMTRVQAAELGLWRIGDWIWHPQIVMPRW